MNNLRKTMLTLDLKEKEYVIWMHLYHKDERKKIAYIISQKKSEEVMSLLKKDNMSQKERILFRYLACSPIYNKQEKKIYYDCKLGEFVGKEYDILQFENLSLDEIQIKGKSLFEILDLISEYGLVERI